jgi:cell division protein FtsQ
MFKRFNLAAKGGVGKLGKLEKLGASSKERMKIRRKRRKRRFLACLFLFTIGALGYFFLTNPIFSVKKISVSGNIKLSDVEIIEKSSLAIGPNIFRENIFAAAGRVRRLSYIKTAAVWPKFPDALQIKVSERIASAKIISGGNVLVIDDSGVLLEIFSNIEGEDLAVGDDFIEIIGIEPERLILGENFAPAASEKLKIAFLYISELRRAGDLEDFRSVNVSDAARIKLDYKGKITADVAGIDDAEYKIRFLMKILNENLSGESGVLTFSSGEFHFEPS